MKRAVVGVFFILWASSAYIWQGRDWNTASRLMLTYAIVDRGTIRLDGLEDQTGDKAFYKGHYYSDKLPGFSILAVPVYAVAKLVLGLPSHPLNRPGFAHWPADYWITLFTSGLATAATGALLTSLAGSLGCGPRRAILIGLAYGLATPAYPYATLAYGHQASAACLLGSFALLCREPERRWHFWAGCAGFLAAWASVIELQVGPASAILGLYAMGLSIGRKRPWVLLRDFAIGAAVPTLILLLYNGLAFGSPFRMGYFYHAVERFSAVHSQTNPLGLRPPDWSRLDDLIIRPARGLIWYAPILILSVPGLIEIALKGWHGIATVCTATIGAALLVNLSYPEWTGGWSTGPRLLLPMIPFAMLGVAGFLGGIRGEGDPITIRAGYAPGSTSFPPSYRDSSPGRVGLAVVLTLLGWGIMTLFQGVGARIPDPLPVLAPGQVDPLAHPLTDVVWPLWRGDRLPPWTFGHRFARTILGPTDDRWTIFRPLISFQVVAASVLILFCKHRGRPLHYSSL